MKKEIEVIVDTFYIILLSLFFIFLLYLI